METDTISLQLPDNLRRHLKRLAALTHQPLDGLIVRTLSASLPPLPDDLAPEARDALQALEALGDVELCAVTRATLFEEQYARVTALRERCRAGTITPEEEAELGRLLDAADLLTLRKAYATVFLKWRGQRLPPVSALAGPDT
jgi:hypothetical protein